MPESPGSRCVGGEAIPEWRLALLDERVGFGRNVTGGAAGCLVRVTTLNEDGPGSLKQALNLPEPAWIVFDVSGTIHSDYSPQWVQDHKTIDGRGADIAIEGNGVEMIGHQNLILTNITIRHVKDRDLIRIAGGSSRFWIHHVTLQDAGDEYIDVSSAKAGVPLEGTISWSRFLPSDRTNREDMAILLGDQNSPETNALIRVTLHHNLFEGTRQRQPMGTGGLFHSFNNVIQYRLYGMLSRNDAQILSEGDVFDAANAEEPHNRAWGTQAEDGGALRIVEPLLLHSAAAEEASPQRVFNPREIYEYSVAPADEALVARVAAEAGRRNVTPP